MKSPFENVNLAWEPKLEYLLASLEVYDREDDGVEMRKLNPNSPKDREQLILKFVLPELDYLSYRHKFALFKLLKEVLDEDDFVFADQFKNDYDECVSMVWNAEDIDEPRVFFLDIYSFAGEVWKDDLLKASMEDRSDW